MLESGHGDAARVGGLAGGVKNVAAEQVLGIGFAGHVGTLGEPDDAVVDQHLGFVRIDLVLSGAGEGQVGLDAPRVAFVEGRLELVGILTDATAPDFFEFFDPGEFFLVDALGVVNEAITVAHGDGFGTEVDEFLRAVEGNIARAGDQGCLAIHSIIRRVKHLAHEVHDAVAGGLGATDAATKIDTLAGDGSGEGVGEAFVLAEEVADLTASNADVTGGHIGVRSDVVVEFRHERLTKAHDLAVAFLLGIEIGPALGATHRETREAVFEDLFEAEELQHALSDGGMKTHPAFVGSNGVAELDAPGAIRAHVACVIDPTYTERDHAIRFGESFEDAIVLKLFVVRDEGQHIGSHFLDGLMEFVLAGVALAQAVHELIEIGAGVHCGCSEVEGKGSSGSCHSGGDARGDGGVERIRENTVGSQSCNGFRQRVGRGDLHLVGDPCGLTVKGAAEDAGEGEDVVDLIWEVAAAGADDGGSSPACFIGHDLGGGIGHREDDRIGGHRADVLGGEEVALADANEDIRADEDVLQSAGALAKVGVAEQGLFLRVQVGASGVDGSFAIADDDLCDGHAGGFGVTDAAQESRDGRARRSGTIDDHFEALQGAVDDFAGVDQGG